MLTSDDDLDDEDIRRNRRVTVPLTVTMIIIAAYIWIGSALFHNFEGWTMTQSGYFCFITLGNQSIHLSFESNKNTLSFFCFLKQLSVSEILYLPFSSIQIQLLEYSLEDILCYTKPTTAETVLGR